jgi:hypothetical protein
MSSKGLSESISTIVTLSSRHVETIPVAPNEWLRRPRRIRLFVLAAAAMIVFAFLMALQLASSPNAHNGTAKPLSGIVFFLAFAVPCVWLGWRVARSGLLIGPDGLLVRGPLRDWRVQPSEAVRFAPGVQRGAGNGTPCPILKRVNGAPVGVWALGREGLIWNYNNYLEEFEPLCERLNQLLAQQCPEHPAAVFHEPTAR